MDSSIYINMFASMNPKTRLLKKISECNAKEIPTVLSGLNEEEKEFLYNELFLEIKPTESLSIKVGQKGEEIISITISTSRLLIIYDWFNRSKHTENFHDILKTERARKYFAKAEKKGYLKRTSTGYKSNFKTKVLLAYFLELVFCRDDNNKDNHQKFPETMLNKLFQEKRLGKARGQISNNKNGGGRPGGYEIVDAIFD